MIIYTVLMVLVMLFVSSLSDSMVEFLLTTGLSALAIYALFLVVNRLSRW